MDKQTELTIVRQSYAKQVLTAAGVNDARIESAYAAVRREDFLGPGPWEIVCSGNYVRTPSDDPVYLYTNDCARCRRARRSCWRRRRLLQRDIRRTRWKEWPGYSDRIPSRTRDAGQSQSPRLFQCRGPAGGTARSRRFREAHVVYVNAGATRPADIWLDQLAEGGRLVLPLTTDQGFSDTFDKITSGVVFRIERRGDAYLANWRLPLLYFPVPEAETRSQSSLLPKRWARAASRR
jgi:protein-L-isoaspartate(D-aspartate) O-methyltransferase